MTDSFTKLILINKGIDRNFNFLVPEVIKQVEDTLTVLEKNNIGLIEKIIARDDYIDNLKSTIENKCFNSILTAGLEKKVLDVIKAVVIITSNLEHIADHAVNIVSQVKYFKTHDFIKQYEYQEFFAEVLTALGSINDALFVRDISLALGICKAEYNLDIIFARNFKKIISELKTGKNTENLVTTLFILRYLERMGDSILNIGEAVLLAAIGHKLKIRDFEAIEDSLQNSNFQEPIADLAIDAVTDTKSGCKIKHIYENERLNTDDDKGVIFKGGNPVKIAKEKENIQLWEETIPGLPPQIFGFQKKENDASMLLEYLKGNTFQQIVIDRDNNLLSDSLYELFGVISETWQKTKRDEEVISCFMKQAIARIEDIYRIHPDFYVNERKIGSLTIHSFKQLLLMANTRESALKAPFSVLTHGDFNIDNIIYNKDEKKIHYVDFYRTAQQDYIQDVSVFLVSNFRQPFFMARIRERLNRVVVDFYRFAKNFALQNNDDTFSARLAFGLARSFITSTRFEINQEFAMEMQKRSVYLLEKIINFQGDWQSFQFPENILVY